jgi:prevent-host-death family protein
MSSTDAKQSFGAALDAAQRHPILIQKQNRDVAVLMSVQEYDKLRGMRLKILDNIADQIAAEARRRGYTDQQLEAMIADVS